MGPTNEQTVQFTFIRPQGSELFNRLHPVSTSNYACTCSQPYKTHWLVCAYKLKRRSNPILSIVFYATTYSGRDLDETFIQHGLGLLLIAKSHQEPVFRKVASSIASSDEIAKEQGRRALRRWAISSRGNNHNAYSALAEKARKASPGKADTIYRHFRSISTCEWQHNCTGREDGAIRSLKSVSGSLIRLLKTREVVGDDAPSAAAPPAAAPSAAAQPALLPSEGRGQAHEQSTIKSRGNDGSTATSELDALASGLAQVSHRSGC